MRKYKIYSVITTIQAPTKAVRELCNTLSGFSGRLLVVGDKKGPHVYAVTGAELFSLERQLSMPLRLPQLLPLNHYTRKNIGYLVAISRGAECIYETDDDNMPSAVWRPRDRVAKAASVDEPGWFNVYRCFTDDLIWPRGFPLNCIAKTGKRTLPRGKANSILSHIQQGLVDGSPDVDALWRLVMDKPFEFWQDASVSLMPGVWCPFNSQSTWWWPGAYPLMYLPSYCSFRMTDIWRSFVAQRCLWALGGVVTFHAPEVVQQRNVHDLMKDFQDEIPGYLSNNDIVQILEDLQLEPDPDAVGINMLMCYNALINRGILPRKELTLIKAWLRDLEKVKRGLRL